MSARPARPAHGLEAAAAALAEALLRGQLRQRWAHSRWVAATARRLAHGLDPDQVATAVAAAWLHDIGYAPAVAAAGSGFHALDGAVYLHRTGWPADIVGLVAHHTHANLEADRRGLADQLAQFVDQPGPVRDVLWAADATTTPDGQPCTVDQRVAEVITRYSPDHLVAVCMRDNADTLRAAVQRVTARLAGPVAGR